MALPPQQYTYDVALSYAGEDRNYVEALADALKRRGLKIFYDKYEKSILWGQDLYTYLSDLYEKKALYCVVFLSQHYAAKVWTRHELKAAQARALSENREYILPLRLDNSEILGILPTIGYLNWQQETVESIADILIEKLGKKPPPQQAPNPGGETKEISVVFADIRGYTRLSESITPEKMMILLNSYLQIMSKVIWDEEGTISTYSGDTLMAIFNAPLLQENHALRAVRACWNMRLAVLDEQRSQLLDMPISFGFGVNTGLAVVSNLGLDRRMPNYTAIGDAVIVASRLLLNAQDNDILLNHSTFIRVRQHVKVEKLPPLQVKSRSAPLDVWRLREWM